MQRGLEFVAALVETFFFLVADSLLLQRDGDAVVSRGAVEISRGDQQPFARDLFRLFVLPSAGRERIGLAQALGAMAILPGGLAEDSIASPRLPIFSQSMAFW